MIRSTCAVKTSAEAVEVDALGGAHDLQRVGGAGLGMLGRRSACSSATMAAAVRRAASPAGCLPSAAAARTQKRRRSASSRRSEVRAGQVERSCAVALFEHRKVLLHGQFDGLQLHAVPLLSAAASWFLVRSFLAGFGFGDGAWATAACTRCSNLRLHPGHIRLPQRARAVREPAASAAETRMAMDSMAAEANPSRGAEPQKACHQRRDAGGLEYLVGNETDPLRDLLVRQAEQGGPG